MRITTDTGVYVMFWAYYD